MLELTPTTIAVLVIVGTAICGGFYAMGVKAGRHAEGQKIAHHILDAVGYESLEEWQAAIDKRDEDKKTQN